MTIPLVGKKRYIRRDVKVAYAIALLLMFIFSIQIAGASGSIFTGSLSPTTVKLCGSQQKNVTITASNILNVGSVNLTNVAANLKVVPSNGVSFITSSSVNLGSIAKSSTSSINPTWKIACSENNPGNYTAYINYTSTQGLNGSSSDHAAVKIEILNKLDSSAPGVISGSPLLITSQLPSSVFTTDFVNLEIKTNESATCKYSKTSNVKYDNMTNTFKVTGGTTHRETFSGLEEKVHYIYVRCSDSQGNKAQSDFEVSFEVNLPPSVKLNIGNDYLLKAGTFQINLTASENL